jgi:hypothetical protein
MGRSNGYRPKAAVKKEVLLLRARLAECRDDQWVRAGKIMDHITALLGHSYGPMNGKIEPRACSYCKYYGHTRQWCKVRLADEQECEELELDRMLREDRQLFAKLREAPIATTPYDPCKSGQARTFDELGMPFTIDPRVGAIVGAPGDQHYGKWTFDEKGRVVSKI